MSETTPPPDRLTQSIGVLTRRETEARVIAPLIEALADRFDRDAVLEVLRDTVIRLAQDQGQSLAAEFGNDSTAFLETLEFWKQDGALEIDVLEHSDDVLDFNVTRCRYAELYRALGIADLGAVLSCNRDFAMVEGFNPEARLTRDQTILGGAPCCTFRYRFPPAKD